MRSRIAAGPAALALLGLVLLALASPVQADGTRETAGAFQLGLLGGVVVDPALFEIEHVFGTAGLVLGYQGRLGISLRPALLFNTHVLLLRFPLVLSVPLRDPSGGFSAALTAGVGACTWKDGAYPELWPLLSAGGEVSLRPFLLSVAASAVIRADNPDLVGDFQLIYLHGLRNSPFRGQGGAGRSK